MRVYVDLGSCETLLGFCDKEVDVLGQMCKVFEAILNLSADADSNETLVNPASYLHNFVARNSTKAIDISEAQAANPRQISTIASMSFSVIKILQLLYNQTLRRLRLLNSYMNRQNLKSILQVAYTRTSQGISNLSKSDKEV